MLPAGPSCPPYWPSAAVARNGACTRLAAESEAACHDGSMADEDWYYCLNHKRAEHGLTCPAKDRLGPYPDAATAARALDIARERNEFTMADLLRFVGDISPIDGITTI